MFIDTITESLASEIVKKTSIYKSPYTNVTPARGAIRFVSSPTASVTKSCVLRSLLGVEGLIQQS